MKLDPRGPTEPFVCFSKPAGFTVGDFWRWGVSDLLVNTTRGAVAEFIVGQALGCAGPVRDSWGPFDLCTADGIKVEVKSASYRQAWKTAKPSRIQFDIAPARAWDSETNKLSGEPKRHADVYVFCLLNNEQQDPADPLKLDRWEFFVLGTNVLDAHCKSQRTIGLNTVRKLKAINCDFTSLPQGVESAFHGRLVLQDPTVEPPSASLKRIESNGEGQPARAG